MKNKTKYIKTIVDDKSALDGTYRLNADGSYDWEDEDNYWPSSENKARWRFWNERNDED